MARASAWGLGSALAYEALDMEAQARLLCLYTAARVREGEEAQQVLEGAAVSILSAYSSARGSATPSQGKANPVHEWAGDQSYGADLFVGGV